MYQTINRADFLSPIGPDKVSRTSSNVSRTSGFNQILSQALAAVGQTSGLSQVQSSLSSTSAGAYSSSGSFRTTQPVSAATASFGTGGFWMPWLGSGLDDEALSGNGGLGDPLSTHENGYFWENVSTGGAEQVGSDIYQFHFPHITEKDGTYCAYFIDHNGGTENEVGLATSEDGVNFTYQGKVLERDSEFDQEQASFPCVQYDGETGLWYMLYEGKSAEGDVNSVCLAVSEDGINWDKKGPVIEPGDAALAKIDAGTPTMFKEDGVWHVYFHGLAQDGRVRIGYASGTDLSDLTVSKSPLLNVDATGYESGTVGARSNVVKLGDYYYMAYETCTANTQFADSQWSTNLARAASPDGPWEKLAGAPLLINPETGFGHDGPELVAEDGELYLYYRDKGNTTTRTQILGLEGARAAHDS